MTPAASGHVNMVIVIAVVLSAILEVLDSTIVNVALPHIQAAFGATTDQATWILTSYIVFVVVIMPLTVFVARHVGRRRLILTAVTGFCRHVDDVRHVLEPWRLLRRSSRGCPCIASAGQRIAGRQSRERSD